MKKEAQRNVSKRILPGTDNNPACPSTISSRETKAAAAAIVRRKARM
jgi:hypothetical protein